MTTSIIIKPHAVEPNTGVELTVFGEGETQTYFVPNGETFDTVIFGTKRFIAKESQAPNENDAVDVRIGNVSARSFNPSNNQTVDGTKMLVETLADYIESEVPKCRRRSVALTHLETASMYAVKANFYTDN